MGRRRKQEEQRRKKNKEAAELPIFLYAGLKNSPGWVTPWYLTSTSFEVLEVLVLYLPHFELPIFLICRIKK